MDIAAFATKISQISAVLPALGQLIQTAQVVAPGAAGLSKAGLVINTVIAAEPALVGMEAVLQAAITGMVAAYRSAGTLPPATGTPANG